MRRSFERLSISLLFIGIFLSPQKVSGQKILWTKKVGFEVRHMTSDSDRNMYLTGRFEGTIDVDPSENEHLITSADQGPEFVVLKLDSTGIFQWVSQFNCNSNTELGVSVAVDQNENVYLGGTFHMSLDVDPSEGIQLIQTTAPFHKDGFLLQLNPEGQLNWFRQFGDPVTEYHTYINSLVTDENGSIYLFGASEGPLDLENTLATTPFNMGAFVMKIDALGNTIWSNHINNHAGTLVPGRHYKLGETPYGMCYKNGNVYIASYIGSNLELDIQGVTTQKIAIGDFDNFVTKIDANGIFQWLNIFGGPGPDFTFSISIDEDDNVISSGTFTDSTDFDPGQGDSTVYASWWSEVFVQKTDTNGEFLWVKTFEVTNAPFQYDWVHSPYVTTDNNNRINLSGVYSSAVDFGPIQSPYYDVPGTSGTYIMQLDENANLQLAVNKGLGSKILGTHGLMNDNILVATQYNKSITLLDQHYYYQSTTACDSLIVGNDVFYSSGEYEIDYLDQYSADSVIVLDLTLGKTTNTSTELNIQYGADYTFPDGVTYSNIVSDTTRSFTINSALGCDSTVNMQIEIIPDLTYGSSCALATEVDKGYYLMPANTTSWFKYKAHYDGELFISTCGLTDEDTYIYVYESCGIFLTESDDDCGDYQSEVSVVMKAGESIWFAMADDYDPLAYEFYVNYIADCSNPDNIYESIELCSGESYTYPDGTVENNISEITSHISALVSVVTGCDSIVTTNITVKEVYAVTEGVNICAGDNYTYPDGTTETNITTSTTHESVLTSLINGCDSTVTTNVIVYTINTNVSTEGNTLSAEEAQADSYQWLDCDLNNAPIDGATNFEFDAPKSGNYELVIEKDGCTGSSGCISLIILEIDDVGKMVHSLWPNPTSAGINIELAEATGPVDIFICDVNGKILSQKKVDSTLKRLTIEIPGNRGIYFVRVQSKANIATYNVLKK